MAKKFGALTDNFAGKRVVLIDDSIVRGNTISPIIKLLKEAGAKEVGLIAFGSSCSHGTHNILAQWLPNWLGWLGLFDNSDGK